jgi:hypothetical protein
MEHFDLPFEIEHKLLKIRELNIYQTDTTILNKALDLLYTLDKQLQDRSLHKEDKE